jgi:hypothetical protein
MEATKKYSTLAVPKTVSPEIDETDIDIYRKITSTQLTEAQKKQILEPPQVYPRQETVLAIHWHPEFVPLPMVLERMESMFPHCRDSLVIPTQHNVPLNLGGYSGVEIDCYSPEFESKVQLLFHFSTARLEKHGDVFKAMCAHTQRYRASQLYDFIASVLEPALQERVDKAAEQTGATDAIIAFARAHVTRLKAMLEKFESSTPREMIKNKLIRNYFDALRDQYENRLINHVQMFLKAVKKIVKKNFALDYFYKTREFIEEGRALGAGIVIPHPEQFWPILLDDLDIDGIEVWNPQSFQYTDFLIEVVHRKNKTRKKRERALLITMGDDCHMGEKVKDPRYQDPEKAGRQVGLQPMWEDLETSKKLIIAGQSRQRVIEEYRSRLES